MTAQLHLNPTKTLFYRFIAGVIRTLSVLIYRPTIVGQENIPYDGPVIIAPVHRSNVDFAFSLFISRRKIFFMAKDSLFRVPIVGPAVAALGAFPVNRSATDRESMKAAESVLGAAQALLMFPEGTRKFGPTVEGLRDGAMFIAARSGASVVPVGIAGSDYLFGPQGHRRWPKVNIVIGQPILPPSNEVRISRREVSQKTEELRAALEAAYREALSS